MSNEQSSKYTTAFFRVVDTALDQHAQSLKRRVLAQYQDMPWTAEHYHQLQSLIRSELDELMNYFFGILDNVGGTRVPDNVLGYRLLVTPLYEDDSQNMETLPDVDLSQNERDYADLWRAYLANKYKRSSQ